MVRATFHKFEETSFLIYTSFVRPLLEYYNVIWTPDKRKQQILIEQVQIRATRMVKGIEHLNYSERLRAFGLVTLYYRRCRADVIQVYRIINNINLINMNYFFSYDRGNGKKLFN